MIITVKNAGNVIYQQDIPDSPKVLGSLRRFLSKQATGGDFQTTLDQGAVKMEFTNVAYDIPVFIRLANPPTPKPRPIPVAIP